MQNILGRSHPDLSGLRALNNAADGSLRLAPRLKIIEKKAIGILFTFWDILYCGSNISVVANYKL